MSKNLFPLLKTLDTTVGKNLVYAYKDLDSTVTTRIINHTITRVLLQDPLWIQCRSWYNPGQSIGRTGCMTKNGRMAESSGIEYVDKVVKNKRSVRFDDEP